jgi:hypothetical protein
MSRLLAGALSLLFLLPALAQEAKEAKTEVASPLAIILFLILFIGSGLAYAAYLWWTHKKEGQKVEE